MKPFRSYTVSEEFGIQEALHPLRDVVQFECGGKLAQASN